MFAVSAPGRAHAVGSEGGAGLAHRTGADPGCQHLSNTWLSPLSSVELPCLQGQFAQGFPHCLCFRRHLQGLQEGCCPGEEGGQSTSVTQGLEELRDTSSGAGGGGRRPETFALFV